MALLDQMTDRVSAAVWNLHPRRAVGVGKHTYDGVVPDLSAGAIEAGLDRLGRLREQLTGLAGLTPGQEVEREVLLGVVDRERFEASVARRWSRDPGSYLEALDITVYLERDYAPAGLRLERAAAVLGEAGSVLRTARDNLDPVLPRAWVEAALLQIGSVAAWLRGLEQTGPGPAFPADEAAWFREAAGHAAAELGSFAAWLREERLPAAADAFALGREGLEEWLWATERLEGAAEDAAHAGAALLEEDRAALARAVPSGPVPAPWGPGAVEAALDRARRFVADRDLVTVPGSPGLRVLGGSRPARGPGWLQAPGSYDDPATGAVLCLAHGWVPGRGDLDALAVALAWPGRLLQGLAAAAAPGEARKRFPSRAFEEGWELYSGDLMAEAGFVAWAPAWFPATLRRAVVEDCRLVCVTGLHARGMAVEEAADLFIGVAGLPEAAGRAEALRCAADPGCAARALGRIAFRRLRRRRGGEARAAFHDALLSAGAVPVGLLDRVLP